MVTRNDFTEGLKKQAYSYFFESYDFTPTIYTSIYREEPSTAGYEQGTSVIGVGQLVEKPRNEPISYQKIQEGWTTYGDNHTYARGVEFEMEMVDDHQRISGLVQQAAKSWGEEVRRTKEVFYATAFNQGGKTAGHDFFKNPIAGQNAGGLLYDGKPLFNLANNLRASKTGGTYFNSLALAFSLANLQTAWNLMVATNNRDERDEIISLRPDVILYPPALKFTIETILETVTTGGANLEKNILAGILKPIQWDYLTDTDAWFILKTGFGLVAQNRQEPVIDFYQDEDTKSYKMNVYCRFGARFDNWRGVVASQVSTS